MSLLASSGTSFLAAAALDDDTSGMRPVSAASTAYSDAESLGMDAEQDIKAFKEQAIKKINFIVDSMSRENSQFLDDSIQVGGVNQPADRSRDAFKDALAEAIRNWKFFLYKLPDIIDTDTDTSDNESDNSSIAGFEIDVFAAVEEFIATQRRSDGGELIKGGLVKGKLELFGETMLHESVNSDRRTAKDFMTFVMVAIGNS